MSERRFSNILFAIMICLFLPIKGQAQTNIVFDLDGTLIQGLPYAKLSAVKEARTFQVNDDRYYTYVLRPGADKVIQKLLADPSFTLYVSSTLPKSRTDLILKAMLPDGSDLAKAVKKEGGDILYTSGATDLRQITPAIFVTSSPQATSIPSSNRVFLGQAQYYFDSFKLASYERSSLDSSGYLSSHEAYLPEDEEDFDKERTKLASIYFSLIDRKNSGINPQLIQSDFDRGAHIKLAKDYEKAGFKDERLAVKDGSCVEESLLGTDVSAVSPIRCVKELAIRLEWNGKACRPVDSDLDLSIDLKDCVEILPVEFRWIGPRQEKCQAFNENSPLGTVDSSKCSIVHALYNSQTNAWETLTAFPGIESMSSTELLDLFSSEPIETIAEENPSEISISDVTFPRTGELLWRAMARAQYDESKAIAAMLGDDTANIESKVFTHIRNSLENRPSPFSFSFSGDLKREFKEALKQAPMSPGLAVQKTKALMAGYFNSIDDDTKNSTMLNYSSSSYLDWNPFAIFSSIAPAVCHFYGYPVLVSFKEKKVRSIDLNYYNYIENSYWNGGYGSGVQADVGEFFTPSHVEASELEGFFQTSPKSGKVGTSLLKVSYKGRPYIAGVVSPRNLHCLAVAQEDQTIRECDSTKDFYSVTTTEPPTRPAKRVVDADFLIRLCKVNETCALDSGAARKYGLKRGGDELNSEWQKILKKINIHGRSPKLFYVDEALSPGETATRN